MNKMLGIAFFFGIFITLYGGIHLYTLSRIAQLFDIRRGAVFYSVMIFLIFSYIISINLEKRFDNFITKTFYKAASDWFGIIFLLFCTVIIADIINLVIPMDPRVTGIGIILIAGTLTTISIYNAQTILIKEYKIKISGIDKDVRLVHLSDLHLGTIYQPDYLEKVIKKTNSLDPDIVAITGDLFDSSGLKNGDTLTSLNDLKAETYFTTGNHEMYETMDVVNQKIKNTKIKTIRNKAVYSKGLQIIGADDPSFGKKIGDILQEIDVSNPSILMFHQPAGVKEISGKGINLVLSGHTHNGQIFPFNLLVRLFFPFTTGLHKISGTTFHVSPGTGTWGPRMRLGSRNQITLFKLSSTN